MQMLLKIKINDNTCSTNYHSLMHCTIAIRQSWIQEGGGGLIDFDNNNLKSMTLLLRSSSDGSDGNKIITD